MKSPELSAFLQTIPHTQFHPHVRLLTWHPRGTLDDALADRITAALALDEGGDSLPFHRYTDLSRLTDVHLKIGHVFDIARSRRASSDAVQSAFFADTTVGFGIARLYEELMHGCAIQVRAFRSRNAAAEWLGVPPLLLQSERKEDGAPSSSQ